MLNLHVTLKKHFIEKVCVQHFWKRNLLFCIRHLNTQFKIVFIGVSCISKIWINRRSFEKIQDLKKHILFLQCCLSVSRVYGASLRPNQLQRHWQTWHERLDVDITTLTMPGLKSVLYNITQSTSGLFMTLQNIGRLRSQQHPSVAHMEPKTLFVALWFPVVM